MAENEDPVIVRKEVVNTFRINGFVLKKDGTELLVELLERYLDQEKRKRWLTKIIENVRKQSLASNVIDLEIVKNILNQISTRNSEKYTTILNVFDAFTIPRFDYDTDTRKMRPAREPLKVVGSVSKATNSMRQRFALVFQKLQRNKIFNQFKFNVVESLLSSSSRMDQVVVLGMLTSREADQFHVEDLTGSVQLEFTADTRYHGGLFCEGSIMIFEGSYHSLVFTVTGVGLISAETALETRQALGNENWFGGEDKICFRANEKLLRLGDQHRDSFFAVLSDVHLDNLTVLSALRHLLAGYSSSPPAAFIFCGNFCSRSRQTQTMELLEQGFRRLSTLINEHKNEYANTHFVFVPGPDDPSLNFVLPRPHLPEILFKHLQQIPNCHFTSNPARIQFASKEIVIIRDNTIERMSKHCVSVPSDKNKIFSSAVKTLLSNAHLCPLPSHVAPVMWDFDHTLRLHPLPDCLVLADKFASNSVKEADCCVVNPGSFYRQPHEFQVLYPIRGDVEASELGKVDDLVDI